MKILEYQCFELLKNNGFKTKWYFILNSIAELKTFDYSAIKYPVLVKAQVLSKSRGKAGGVKIANNKDELVKYANDIFNLKVIDKEKIQSIAIMEYTNISKELYLSISYSRIKNSFIFTYNKNGGANVEESNTFKEYYINPSTKSFFFLNKKLKKFVLKLLDLFINNNLQTLEINPLAINENKEYVICDCKIETSDNEEQLSWKVLDTKGVLSIMSFGAGLILSTMDECIINKKLVHSICDIGGTALDEKTIVELINKAPTKYILINSSYYYNYRNNNVYDAINNGKFSKKIILLSEKSNIVNKQKATVYNNIIDCLKYVGHN